jgi:anti-sigma-K factor RskA
LFYVRQHSSAAEQAAEKLASATSGAKALTENKDVIAALEALRHPKASFSAACEAGIVLAGLTARLESRALSNPQFAHTAADEVDYFQSVAFFEWCVSPAIAGHDVVVQFNGYTVCLHAEDFHEVGKGRRRGG